MFGMKRRAIAREIEAEVTTDFIHNEKSPDSWKLELHHWQLLFVYDDMMSGRPMNDLINYDAIHLDPLLDSRPEIITVEKFSMWRKDRLAFLLPRDYIGAPRHHVKGELHAVRPHVITEGLDKLKRNGVIFNRKRVRLVIPYFYRDGLEHHATIVKAWTYVGREEFWEDKLDCGYEYTPIQVYRRDNFAIRSLSEYYYFDRESTNQT